MMNDLYVGAVTGTTKRLEKTNPIQNIPIKKVFRLTVVFTPKFLEVYINGNLEQSLVLQNTPIQIPSNAYFFPTISTINNNVMVANIAFWPRAITPNEIRTDGAPIAKETFFFKTAS